MSAPAKCPTCESPKPSRHPSVQFEGEVQICADPWHGLSAPAESKHTPGELKLRHVPESFHDNGHWRLFVNDGESGRDIADVYEFGEDDAAEAAANAARLALSWNNHEELVEALKEAAKWEHQMNVETHAKIRAALAKVSGVSK